VSPRYEDDTLFYGHIFKSAVLVHFYTAANTREQDPAQVAAFLKVKFSKIQRLAEKTGADIGFEDEAGVELRTRAGCTWGEGEIRPRWWSPINGAVTTCCPSSRRKANCITHWKPTISMANGMWRFANRSSAVEPDR
jgi:hypothetical protein